MATHSELLAAGWNGQTYSLNGSNFGNDDSAFAGALTWFPGNSLPKPVLADLEARRAEIEAIIATAERQKKWRDELMEREDKLLQAMEVLAGAVDDLQAKVRVNSALSAPLQTQVDTLVTRLAQIRAIT